MTIRTAIERDLPALTEIFSNEASVRLHEKPGFTFSGRLREVGVKFGKRLYQFPFKV